MNIRDNIMNYLCDRDYCLCIYDDYLYIFNYRYLNSFDDKRILISLKGRVIEIYGSNLLIVRITKEELLIRGTIERIETKKCDE